MSNKRGQESKQKHCGSASNFKSEKIILIATYKQDVNQLEWIEKNHLYNYPLSKDEINYEIQDWSNVKELWLYSGLADKRHVFSSKFVGIKSRKEFIDEYRSYPQGHGKHGDFYAVFSVKSKYATSISNAKAIVRVYDFVKHTPKIAQIIENYQKNGEIGHLIDFLPTELSSFEADKLKVCDEAIQMSFWDLPYFKNLKPEVPFPSPKEPKFTFIDLFAGIGGFRIAMQRQGGECIFSSEFDLQAQKTYQANFGETPYGDITKQETHSLIPKSFDVVCAGFPCQAFSLAGKRLGFNDLYKGLSRGTLFSEVVKICEKHKPKAVFCENVKGLFIHDKGNTFKVIKTEFEALGYKFFHKILNSKDFGVPQQRERIYMVAFREDYAPDGYDFLFPEPTKVKVSLNDIRENNVSAKYYLSDVYVDTLRKHKERHAAAGHGFGYVIRDWDGVSGAIVCGGMGRETNLVKEEFGTPNGLVPVTNIRGSINKEGIRKMTPREWARLQGFPEEFKFVVSDVHLYKQFGNSVTIPVVEAISKKIVSHILEVDAAR